MIGHDQEVQEEAERAQRLLREHAAREYPQADGFTHDEASDGWPDPRMLLRVYREGKLVASLGVRDGRVVHAREHAWNRGRT